jgi:hypothetical protein
VNAYYFIPHPLLPPDFVNRAFPPHFSFTSTLSPFAAYMASMETLIAWRDCKVVPNAPINLEEAKKTYQDPCPYSLEHALASAGLRENEMQDIRNAFKDATRGVNRTANAYEKNQTFGKDLPEKWKKWLETEREREDEAAKKKKEAKKAAEKQKETKKRPTKKKKDEDDNKDRDEDNSKGSGGDGNGNGAGGASAGPNGGGGDQSGRGACGGGHGESTNYNPPRIPYQLGDDFPFTIATLTKGPGGDLGPFPEDRKGVLCKESNYHDPTTGPSPSAKIAADWWVQNRMHPPSLSFSSEISVDDTSFSNAVV